MDLAQILDTLDNVKFTDSVMLAIPAYKDHMVFTSSRYLFHSYDETSDVLTGYFLVNITDAEDFRKFSSLEVMKFVSQKPTSNLGNRYTGRFVISEAPVENCDFVMSHYLTFFELELSSDNSRITVSTGDDKCRVIADMEYNQDTIDRVRYEIQTDFNSPFRYDSKFAVYMNKSRARKVIEDLIDERSKQSMQELNS